MCNRSVRTISEFLKKEKHIDKNDVFIDTSAYTAKRLPEELVAYLKTNGRKKVLFGTNYPMITSAKCLEDLDQLRLDDEVEAMFLYGNAKQVFKID